MWLNDKQEPNTMMAADKGVWYNLACSVRMRSIIRDWIAPRYCDSPTGDGAHIMSILCAVHHLVMDCISGQFYVQSTTLVMDCISDQFYVRSTTW